MNWKIDSMADQNHQQTRSWQPRGDAHRPEASLAPLGASEIRPIWLLRPGEGIDKLAPSYRRWLAVQGFDTAKSGTLVIPDTDGGIAGAVHVLGDGHSYPAMFSVAALPELLPDGDYQLQGRLTAEEAQCATLAWLLGRYQFDRYRRPTPAPRRRLVVAEGVDRARAVALAEAVWLARDLINTPSNDMGPADLEGAARTAVAPFGAAVTSIIGDDLIEQRFPMIHAVGRASTRAPRLVDIRWGDPKHPKVTLVGKGICFDTGGLDIKTADGMSLMKKDMGGAASVLALAIMIMAARLPYRLRVLLPIAENSISGNAFRPGDVLSTRAGVSVEIGNTDAEGRLVLADAMTLACEEQPALLVTMATLTGAARVAMGPDLPPFYCDDDHFASSLQAAGARVGDPVWRLPFWKPYDSLLSSRIADLNNVSSGPHAGSITAALFLKRFAQGAERYVHFDIFGWAPRPKPWVAEGGEVQGARALFEQLQQTGLV